MNLRTQIAIPKSEQQIDYQSKIMLFGSCFSENIGEQLAYRKFETLSNPFGILFQPLAIENCIKRLVNKTETTASELLKHNELWHSLETHSDCSFPKKEDTTNHINKAITEGNKYLSQASHIIITLGTAWTYFWKETGKPVANCHKIPQKQFNKQLLKVPEIVESLKNSISFIQSINPSANITFTVSPVRHTKDGIVENSRSKAHLLAAVHEVVDTNAQCSYFPAYEIVNDDLRDYRFYNRDLVHPNEMAVDYIWEAFVKSNINKNALSIMEQVATVQKGLAHRPFNPKSDSHQKFLKNLTQKKNALKSQYNITF